MSYSNDLSRGLALLIQDAGLALYRETGVYATGETGITVGVMPDSPDRIICLTPYPVEDGALTDAITGMQIRMRASTDPRVVQDTADDLFDLLHRRRGYVLGGVRVAVSWRQSEDWIGVDGRNRMEKTANYYLRTTRTSPHLDE